MNAVSGIVTMLVVSMLLIIGLITYSGFTGSVNTTTMTDGDASAAINATKDNTYTGFDIASNLPLVLGAVAVIGVVVAGFAILA